MGRYLNKKKKFVKDVSRLSDIPNLEPGQIIVAVENNRMLDSAVVPYLNKNSKVPWIWDYGDGPGAIKTCPGTTDLAHLGVTFPLWADFRCRMGPEGNLEYELNIAREDNSPGVAGLMQEFTFGQTGPCPWTDLRDKSIEQAGYIKIVSPYYIKTPKGYSILITGHPMYPRKEFVVVPGIVNTDSYHTVNVVLNVLTPNEFYVAQGTPIAQVIVFKRSDNVKEIIEGDESVYRLLSHLGFGGPWPPKWRKGKYKREQRRWDR
jgi:dUTPase